MGLLDMFRPRPPIGDMPALAAFIDENAAFLTQKGIYEYSRARAGHYAKVLFSESGFQEAVENARWRAYPLGLAMVAELVEGVLRSHGGAERQAVLDALAAMVLAVFDRYAVPAALSGADWRDCRNELEGRARERHPGAVRRGVFRAHADRSKAPRERVPDDPELSQGDALQYPRGVFKTRRRAGPRRDAVFGPGAESARRMIAAAGAPAGPNPYRFLGMLLNQRQQAAAIRTTGAG